MNNINNPYLYCFWLITTTIDWNQSGYCTDAQNEACTFISPLFYIYSVFFSTLLFFAPNDNRDREKQSLLHHIYVAVQCKGEWRRKQNIEHQWKECIRFILIVYTKAGKMIHIGESHLLFIWYSSHILYDVWTN